MNAALVEPLTVFALVMAGTPSVMVIDTVTGSDAPVALDAVTTVLVVPVGSVGMPEMTPVLAFKVSPAGNGEAVKLVGLLVAVIV